MTVPKSVFDLPNLQQALDAMGLKARKSRPCLVCRRVVVNAGLVDTSTLGCSLPRFVCATCASGPFRLAQAAEVAPPVGEAWGDNEAANHIRAVRRQKLSDSDWTQVPDAPLTAAQRQDWAVYRQALRDLTETYSSPADVTWPDPPAAAAG